MSGDNPGGPVEHWTVEEAEELLCSLDGVISARLVATPRGVVEEVHLLTTSDVAPKATVRNVESALRARFDLTIDHRKISVARSHRPIAAPESEPTVEPTPAPGPESSTVPQGTRGHPLPPPASHEPTFQAASGQESSSGVSHGVIESPWGAPPDEVLTPRLIFLKHRQDRERSRRIRMTVELGWGGKTFEGFASTVDVPRARLEATAEATLLAVRGAIENEGITSSLDLDGVEIIDALDHSYALVSVHAVVDGRFAPLTGVVGVESDPEQAVILATLRATERPVRKILGRHLGDTLAERGTPSERDVTRVNEATTQAGDPLKLWGGS